ncbi:hypothetical protein F7725_016427 [Dissostichus mawsoni]|uniref:Uncharacterized protein n=1 Tax=Dissostichus mawsoni TaxID=36200 RepID=A0A7J5Z1P0_DISMA|nr:hypothetical protein F7725_016427 [Dissostichus mawsoni]
MFTIRSTHSSQPAKELQRRDLAQSFLLFAAGEEDVTAGISQKLVDFTSLSFTSNLNVDDLRPISVRQHSSSAAGLQQRHLKLQDRDT